MERSRRKWCWSASPTLVVGLTAVLAGSVARPIMAGDPLATIPSDVCGVIAIRNPDQARGKLDELIKEQDPSYGGTDLGILAETLDLGSEAVDWSEPLVFVLTQPNFDFLVETEFNETSAVLAFSPKDPDWYDSLGGAQQVGGIKRVTLGGRKYYAMQREDVVLLGGRRKAMRMLRAEVSTTESLAHALDDEQRAIYARSDLFVHLPMRGWRDRIAFFSLLAANMLRLGMAVEQDAQMLEMGRSVMDWGMRGFERIIEQMESLSLGVSLDGDGFRLTHYHRFAPGGSVADYLRQVTRSEGDLWAALPDRSFYVVGVFDWQTPPELSVAVRFNQYLYDSQLLDARTTPELRKELRDKTIASYGQMMGGCLMVTSPVGQSLPVQVLGGYRMRDAQKGLEQICFIQENAGKTFSGFMGGGYVGPFERRVFNGQEYFEMRLDAGKTDQTLRRQTESLYGPDLRFQNAAIGPHHVMYSMSAAPGLVPEAIRVMAEGNHLGKDPLVRQIRSRLPEKPHGLVLFDLGRLLSAAPDMIRINMTAAGVEASSSPDSSGAETKPASEAAGAPTGPMLGWACVVHPTALRGDLAISVKDAAEVVRLAGKMTREMSRTAASLRRDAGVSFERN